VARLNDFKSQDFWWIAVPLREYNKLEIQVKKKWGMYSEEKRYDPQYQFHGFENEYPGYGSLNSGSYIIIIDGQP